MREILDRRLRLRPPIRAVEIGEGRQLVWVGGQRKVVQGASAHLVPHVIEAADGAADGREIARRAASAASCDEAAAIEVLRRLYDWGVLDDADGYEPPAHVRAPEAQILYLSTVSSRPHRLQARLAGARVATFGPPGLRRPLVETLREAGVGCSSDGLLSEADGPPSGALDGRDLLIVGFPGTVGGDLRVLNRLALAADLPLLLYGGHGGRAFVGPLVLPGESACLACLEGATERVRDVVADATDVSQDCIQASDRAMGWLAPVPALGATLAAIEAIRILSRAFAPALVGRQWFFDPVAFEFRSGPLLKLLRCPACGRLRDRAPATPFEPATESA